jgi:hypothetical protein
VVTFLGKPVKIYGTAYSGPTDVYVVIHALTLQAN